MSSAMACAIGGCWPVSKTRIERVPITAITLPLTILCIVSMKAYTPSPTFTVSYVYGPQDFCGGVAMPASAAASAANAIRPSMVVSSMIGHDGVAPRRFEGRRGDVVVEQELAHFGIAAEPHTECSEVDAFAHVLKRAGAGCARGVHLRVDVREQIAHRTRIVGAAQHGA